MRSPFGSCPRVPVQLSIFVAALCLYASGASAQVWHSRESAFRRKVDTSHLRVGTEAVEVELYLHGARPESIVVYGRARPVLSRILQVGPGDFVRLVFRPQRNQARHWIYSGGELSAPASGELDTSPWGAGLLVETREFVGCDLNSLNSLREAFARASPIGSRIVQQIFHRTNPCAPGSGPFFSRYRGTLQINRAGKYKFFTSSQDCSFLLIDGKVVASAPGRHGPVARARYGGEIELSAGPHRFEYWHAAAGTAACMVAAWQPPGAERPSLIPPSAFGADRAARLRTSGLERRSGKDLPDFVVEHLGAVSLPENKGRLVRVRFVFTGAVGMLRAGKRSWDFGDGQESSADSPVHIYLKPGIYRVRLRITPRGGSPVEVASRVPIWPEPPDPGRPAKEDDIQHYAAAVKNYTAAGLDPESLLVLARVLEYVEEWELLCDKVQEGLANRSQTIAALHIFPLLDIAVPAARVRLHKPEQAVHILRLAAARTASPEDRASLLLRAADISVNDMNRPNLAGELLDHLPVGTDQLRPDDQAAYWRIRGDVLARLGKPEPARDAYRRAARLHAAGTATAIARSGSYGRTIEGLLQDGNFVLAHLQLIAWVDEFPGCKLTGYWHLLRAQLALQERRYDEAIRTVQDGLLVAPDSPYADQLLWIEADASEASKDLVRATRALEQLLDEYPGSPLVEKARNRLRELRTAAGAKP